MTSDFAFLFPGQGSQHIGMLTDLAEKYPLIKHTYDTASEVLGYDLWSLTQEGPEEKLNQTQCTQPALLAAGVAIWKLWEHHEGPRPKFLAGHSLGEYTALVCAEALDYPAAIKLVELRGKYMQQAVPPGQGAMAAIIGLDENLVITICQQASNENHQVSPANFNSIGQIVVAGSREAVELAVTLAKENNAKIAKILPVSVPSHCDLMRPAAQELKEALCSIKLSTPILPVVQNADVCHYQDPKQIQDALVRQLYSPVRWIETVQSIVGQGIHFLLESGPGKVLTGLNKRIVNTATCIAIHSPDSFNEAYSQIGGRSQ